MMIVVIIVLIIIVVVILLIMIITLMLLIIIILGPGGAEQGRGPLGGDGAAWRGRAGKARHRPRGRQWNNKLKQNNNKQHRTRKGNKQHINTNQENNKAGWIPFGDHPLKLERYR